MRILLVEPHEDTHALVAEILDGHSVDWVDTPTEAEGKACLEKFDCYIIEPWVTGDGGLSLCSAIKAQDPNTRIILYTTETRPGKIACEAADQYLFKTQTSPDELRAAVEGTTLN